jgi:3-hydroxyisobutyrate dehydrogenase
MANIGFIGLGNMGGHMARNLIKHGRKIVAFDKIPAALSDMQTAGATVAESPAQVANACHEIITMLPANDEVREVYNGKDGILSGAQSGTLCMDCSTIDPGLSKSLALEAGPKGIAYIDAPVSGGVIAARDAALTFMAGGSDADFARAQPILSQMGKAVVHCGDVGTGQGAKICNNMLLAICMIGTSEVYNLGERLGLEPKLLAQIINSSSGRNWSSDTYNPVPGVIDGVPSSKNYEGGFGTALMTKDLGLAQSAATATKSPTPLGSLAHQLYRLLCAQDGLAQKDFSVVYQFLRRQQQ